MSVLRRVKKRSKERYGPTPGVRLIEMSAYKRCPLKQSSTFLCGASIAIPENFVMTTAYARPSVQTPRTGELKGKTLKVREREPRHAARNCLDES